MIFFRRSLRCICRKALTLMEVRLGISAQGSELLTTQGDCSISGSTVLVFCREASVFVCSLLFIINFISDSPHNTDTGQGTPQIEFDWCGGLLQSDKYSVITMGRWLCLALVLPIAFSACATQCGTCSIDQSPYTCLTCPSNSLSYLSSCPTQDPHLTLFIVLVAVITVLHLFLLAMGIGIYRELFQNIQMVSLISWRYGFEGGSFALQGTNLAMVKSNDFIEIFGFQFLGLCILLLVFWLAIAVVGKVSQSPTAILLRRKRIIFPVRVLTFVFNIVLFASLAQLSTYQLSAIKAIPLALAVIGLLASVGTLVFVGVVSSYRRFQVDDPHYYVLVQQMVTKRWWAKNNTFISLLTRAAIIVSFVVLFQTPQIAGMVMVALQLVYTLYFIVSIRFTRIRYFVVLATNCLLLIAVILASYLGAVAPLYSSAWSQASRAYLSLYLTLIGLFVLASLSEVFLCRELIVKQLKSLYMRFLQCDKSQEKIIVSKYDQGSHRERVTGFRRNLLYKKEERPTVRIEMAIVS